MTVPFSSYGAEIYLRGLADELPGLPTDPGRLEQAARQVLTDGPYGYVAGGAGSGATMRANRAAFDRYGLVPRMLRDTTARDWSTTVLGTAMPAPLLLAPIGVLEMVHPEADLAVARAAAALQVPYVFSNQASVPMEVCAAAMGGARRWFQLYWSRSDELVASLVRRAEACGCEAIVLTLDTTMLGWRPRDLDLGSLPFLRGQGIAQYTSDPVFRAQLATPVASEGAARPPLTAAAVATALAQKANFPGGLLRNLTAGEPRAAVQRFAATYSRPSLRWDDLKFLRQHTKLPLVLKGVLHPDDARQAVALGIDGLVVSNHGGRQIDGEIASLDALPAVAEAVNGRIPVLFDSGIRGGADGFKALALGATAVGLGRPYVYGLALAGQGGVEEVIGNVLAELDLTLGLAGVARVSDLNPAALARDGAG